MEKKEEMEILSPGIRIGEHWIKPWSFGQFLQALPTLIQIGSVLKELEIKIEDLDQIRNNSNLSVLCSRIGPQITTIVAITMNKKEEEILAMDFDVVVGIVLVILIQNADKLKNFSGLGQTAFQTLKTA